MPSKESTDRSLVARIAINTRWAGVEDRAAATAPARAGLERKFLDEAGGDPVRAVNLRKAYFQRLALRSAQARRARRTPPPLAAEERALMEALLHGGDAA